MSLTIPSRIGAPLVPTSSPAPTPTAPAGAPPARPETGLGTFKDGYERSLNGVNPRKTQNLADSSFEGAPGRIADLVRASRAARQSGGRPEKGDVKEIIKRLDPHGVTPEERLPGGSNYRRNSREIGQMG